MVLYGQRNCAERETFLSSVPHNLSEEEKKYSYVVYFLQNFCGFNFPPLLKIIYVNVYLTYLEVCIILNSSFGCKQKGYTKLNKLPKSSVSDF